MQAEIDTKKQIEQFITEIDTPLNHLAGQSEVKPEHLQTIHQYPFNPEISEKISQLSESEIKQIRLQFFHYLIELYKSLGLPLTAEMLNQDITVEQMAQVFPQGQIKEDTITGKLSWFPGLEISQKLFESRLYPLFSQEEIAKHNKAKILIIGASTGSNIALQLIQMGFTNITIVDPDTIETSNLNRIAGATINDIATNKAIHNARFLLATAPHANITAIPRALTREELKEQMSQADVVVEMIDNLAVKTQIRDISTQLHQENPDQAPKFIAMGTNTDTPLFSFEHPNDPLFLRQGLTQEAIQEILNAKNPLQFAAGVISIIGIENTPPRQMINFILIASGKLGYLAQHGSSAAAGAWGVAYTIAKSIDGVDIKEHEQQMSLNNIYDIKTAKQVDDNYFEELKNIYPDIFDEFATFQHAIQELCQSLFDLEYPDSMFN